MYAVRVAVDVGVHRRVRVIIAERKRGRKRRREEIGDARECDSVCGWISLRVRFIWRLCGDGGKAFGQIGVVAPISVAVLAIVMGLNLLGEVQLRFPSFGSNFDPRSLNLPPFLTSFVAGATFALAASPCATPVLSTLLAYVAASSNNVLSGGFLLFSYTLGYSAPLLLAASAAGNIKSVMGVREKTAWVTPASGFLLVAGGWYALLGRVVPMILGA